MDGGFDLWVTSWQADAMRVEAGDQDLSEWATEWFGRHTVGIGAVTVRIYDEPRPTRQ